MPETPGGLPSAFRDGAGEAGAERRGRAEYCYKVAGVRKDWSAFREIFEGAGRPGCKVIVCSGVRWIEMVLSARTGDLDSPFPWNSVLGPRV